MSKRTPQHDRYPIRTVDPGTVEAAEVDPTLIDLMAGDPPRRPRQRGWDGAHRPGKPTQEPSTTKAASQPRTRPKIDQRRYVNGVSASREGWGGGYGIRTPWPR